MRLTSCENMGNERPSLKAHPFIFGRKIDRWIIRGMLRLFQKQILYVEGAANLSNVRGPLIITLNHNHFLEALLAPALLIYCRGGKNIRFMADWNFMLIPPIAYLYYRNRVIPVTRKPARPKFLTVFRNLLAGRETGYHAALKALSNNEVIGIFPEGTANRSPQRLLPGHSGAARLSLQTNCPVLPVGISFPQKIDYKPISDWEPMAFHIGDIMIPPVTLTEVEDQADAVNNWHQQIMKQISQLSGKETFNDSQENFDEQLSKL